MSALSMSLSEWCETRRTAQEWREKAAREWDHIRAGEHYHGGVPCEKVPECKRNRGAS